MSYIRKAATFTSILQPRFGIRTARLPGFPLMADVFLFQRRYYASIGYRYDVVFVRKAVLAFVVADGFGVKNQAALHLLPFCSPEVTPCNLQNQMITAISFPRRPLLMVCYSGADFFSLPYVK
jgi:hypothetical protein